MFLLVLQLLRWKESVCDVDCPPGFEPVEMVTDGHAQSSSALGGNPSAEKSLSSTDHRYVDMTCILECVEDELHFSAKVSLEEYLKSFVQEEVVKLFNSMEDDKLNKVTWKILFFLSSIEPAPAFTILGSGTHTHTHIHTHIYIYP
jgi:hypothetical protein